MSASLATNDRNSIAALQNPPSNQRDASGGSGSTAGSWRQKPTAIPRPETSSRHFRPGGSNPYSSGRLTQDNLHATKGQTQSSSSSRRGSNGGTNPIASNTFVNQNPMHPAKRQKMEAEGSNRRASGTGFGHARSNHGDGALIVGRRDELERGRTDDPPHLALGLPADGANTTSLRQHRNAQAHLERPPLPPEEHEHRANPKEVIDVSDDEEDDIENSSPPKAPLNAGQVNVQKMIQHFSRAPLDLHSQHIPGRTKVAAPPQSHPFMDLGKVTNNKVKSAMRGKNGGGLTITTQNKPPPSRSAGKQQTPHLSVKECYLGDQKLTGSHHLLYGNQGRFTLRTGDRPGLRESQFVIEIDMRARAKLAKFAEPDQLTNERILILEVYPDEQKRPGRSSASKQFAAQVAINFGQVPSDQYEEFINWIKKHVIQANRHLLRGESALRAAWDMAVAPVQSASNSRSKPRQSQSAKSAAKEEEESGDDDELRLKGSEKVEKPSHPRRPSTGPSVIDLDPSQEDLPAAPRRTTRSSDPRSRSQSETASEPSSAQQWRTTRTSGSPHNSDRKLDEVILVYPPGQTGAVNITNGDMVRLKPNEFLNDTLIEFGLKFWLQQLEKSDPELVKQIHVFSSFFYKKLNKRGQMQYNSVAKWTAKFDLFEKKYLIVPINENLHWYLAIIYRPEHVLKPPPPAPATAPPSTRSRGREEAAAAQPSEREPTPEGSRPPDSKATTLSASSPMEEDATPPRSPADEAEVEQALAPVDEDVDMGTDKESNDSLFGGRSEDEEMPSDPAEVNAAVGPDDEQPLMEVEADTSIMSVDPLDTLPRPETKPITRPETKRFYGASSNGKRKATSPLEEASAPAADEVILNSPVEDEAADEDVEVVNGDETQCCIFVLDSLGNRHPRVGSILSQYLRQEALQKKNIPMEQSTNPTYQHALVPQQPNFCDCGLYLLHFAQTFISRPEDFVRIIFSKRRHYTIGERSSDWHIEGTKDMREVMKTNIEALSVEWKKERAAKELERKQQQETETVEDSSDDDIDIVDTVEPSTKKSPKGKSPKKSVRVTRMR
uniref:Ubiquitin-like protease family profile domain-containing protein n=1 Tax=Mycena chlorophos TaxID=658473 RepID=A0ABQ0M9V6_MYCCL|nr:predicted protein [Mycena chlorophos]